MLDNIKELIIWLGVIMVYCGYGKKPLSDKGSKPIIFYK